jgi:hypothetical protein
MGNPKAVLKGGPRVRTSSLPTGGMRSQNPDPLKPKVSATRKSQTSPSAMTYWSGIIYPHVAVKRNKARKGAPPANQGGNVLNLTVPH